MKAAGCGLRRCGVAALRRCGACVYLRPRRNGAECAILTYADPRSADTGDRRPAIGDHQPATRGQGSPDLHGEANGGIIPNITRPSIGGLTIGGRGSARTEVRGSLGGGGPRGLKSAARGGGRKLPPTGNRRSGRGRNRCPANRPGRWRRRRLGASTGKSAGQPVPSARRRILRTDNGEDVHAWLIRSMEPVRW